MKGNKPFNTGKKTKVQQKFKDLATPGNKIRQMERAQMVTDPEGSIFGEGTTHLDYTTMLGQVTDIQQKFQKIDSGIRAKFDNDPQKIINFVHDKKNYQEALKMGLIMPDEGMEAEIKEKAQIEAIKASTPEAPPTPLETEIAEAQQKLANLEKAQKEA